MNLQRGFTSVEQLRRAWRELGTERVLVKILSQQQDNEKNQVYLGSTDALLSIIPGVITFASGSTSNRKRNSIVGQSKTVLNLDFHWFFHDGNTAPAPRAKIIYYFQYPEIRFSGFLSGASSSPDALKRERQALYGRRALLLGIRGQEVFGTVVTDADGSSLINYLASLPVLPGQSVMRVLDFPNSVFAPNLDQLLNEISNFAGCWHPAQRLTAGDSWPQPHQAQQGSGWTLEALLGIPMNSKKGPDKYGYEVKALGSSGALTLITSEPDGGIRKECGLSEFLQRFGWLGAANDGSLRFNGRHDTLRDYHKSNARMIIEHWNAESNAPDGTGEPNVLLVHTPSGEVLASWSYTSLATKWSSKHSGCVYVPYRRWPNTGGLATHYIYEFAAYCGLGTSVNHLLRALSAGVVYTDPGDRMYESGQSKHRMQWRVTGTKKQPLANQLAKLYTEWREIRVSNSAIEAQFAEICALGPSRLPDLLPQ